MYAYTLLSIESNPNVFYHCISLYFAMSPNKTRASFITILDRVFKEIERRRQSISRLVMQVG